MFNYFCMIINTEPWCVISMVSQLVTEHSDTFPNKDNDFPNKTQKRLINFKQVINDDKKYDTKSAN